MYSHLLDKDKGLRPQLGVWWLLLFFLTPTCLLARSVAAPIDQIGIKAVTSTDTGIELIIEARSNGQGVDGAYDFLIDDESVNLFFSRGKAQHKLESSESQNLLLAHDTSDGQLSRFYRLTVNDSSVESRHIPLWVSILPPLIAIAIALILKEVIFALFLGIWIGAFALTGFRFEELFSALLAVVDRYIIQALTDSGHISIIVFSLLIGGMVGIISRNGGMAGIVNSLSRYAHNAKNTQLVTWLLGIAIFFDDYANTLIVGNTMRPVTDKFKISREKLAYIVDSTAAPIAAVAFITTWIGAELGYIEDAVEKIGLEESPYSLFLGSLNYSFYPILTLIFIFLLVMTGKDYGPMYTAEWRARTTGEVSKFKNVKGTKIDDEAAKLDALKPIEGINYHWYNALLPVFTVIFGTVMGLIYTGSTPEILNNPELGWGGKLREIIGNADSYAALLWSSTAGVIVAMLLTIGGKIMSLRESVETLMEGIKTMIPAVVILVLAWSIAKITEDLHTATYLTSLIEGNISPYLMPAITFILAGFVAFSTGSSWGTMAILYPLILPTTWALSISAGMAPEAIMPIFYNVIACVLAGAVLGDHCSPISDTTILSSLACSCDHIDHVRTQLPYALTVGSISVVLGLVSVLVGWPSIFNFLIGIGLLFLVVRYIGKKVPAE